MVSQLILTHIFLRAFINQLTDFLQTRRLHSELIGQTLET